MNFCSYRKIEIQHDLYIKLCAHVKLTAMHDLFPEVSQFSRLSSEMARYDGRVKQIFLTSV